MPHNRDPKHQGDAAKGSNGANPWLSAYSAMTEEWFAHWRRMASLPALWRKARQIEKGATPSEVVYEEDRLRLLHYPSDSPVKYKTPLLFVFALVNRSYVLDLLPKKSVVSHFVKAGFDTYLLDWGTPTYADRNKRLTDYIDRYLVNVTDFLTERTGSPQTSILGYCMGGTMSAMFTSLYQQRVKNLILLAAGIDFSTREGLLNLWTDPRYFDVDALIDAYGNCPAELLQSSFLTLKPVANLIQKPLGLYERLDDEKYVDEYLTMESWLNDNVAVPGGVFREFVKYLYQQNRLTKGRMPVGGRNVDLGRITCPVLNLMATRDDLVPCAQSEPFTELVGSEDREEIKLSAGHIGLAVGSKAHKELWPEACRWLAERS